ncbi:hypothetical protein NDU88_006270 [Pleurodeles waltl]|uniref:Uncharacterized protein n=1 Tax=Pleurodeles waltl TaxID=8319 RepID=A0AAV7TDF2_PLEWA|nr:hypothetical protein NDU88_006270 [Pleurodeles waltl]
MICGLGGRRLTVRLYLRITVNYRASRAAGGWDGETHMGSRGLNGWPDCVRRSRLSQRPLESVQRRSIGALWGLKRDCPAWWEL